MRIAALVEVRLRPGIADPEGGTVERAIAALGVEGISRVSMGRAIRFEVEAVSVDEAEEIVDDLCRRLLVNPVLEEETTTLVALDDTPDDEVPPVDLPVGEPEADEGAPFQ
jgi:phosphoribosylformylglycinamidine synthase